MNEELNKKMEEHFRLNEEMKKLKEQDDLLKEEIKSIMMVEGIEFYENDGATIKVREQERVSLNRKAVEERLAPNLLQECLKVSKFTVVDIKTKERNKQLKEMFKDKK